MKSESTSPRMKMRRAYGTFGIFCVRSSVAKANRAHIRLSAELGVVQPRGWRRVVPAERTKESPAPTWIPLTTGVGITWVNHLSIPVALKMKTAPAVVKPADTVSSMENFLAIATAAMAFQSISSRDHKVVRWTYFHRLHRQRDSKGHTSENVP